LLLDRKIITKKPTIKKGESKLEKYLVALMNRYGRDIFKHEYDCTEQQIEKLAHILVCSRNRIAHIRRNDERRYLLKEENIIYLQKLSVLYRVIIFDVLGITNIKPILESEELQLIKKDLGVAREPKENFLEFLVGSWEIEEHYAMFLEEYNNVLQSVMDSVNTMDLTGIGPNRWRF
jgi:hypothetical protein